MAFAASTIEIALRYTVAGQNCQTARQYTWDGVAIASASPAQLGEGWWNHYKTVWRAMAPASFANAQFLSVFVREIGGNLTYGEFPIPSGEQAGTRTSGTGSLMPSYCAVGVRLAVGSGVTRPGQMRVPFLMDSDTDRNAVDAAFVTLASNLATLYSQTNVLGAPVATGTITPQVVTYGANNNTIAAQQDVVGYVVNSFATSQVSRRYGHGN